MLILVHLNVSNSFFPTLSLFPLWVPSKCSFILCHMMHLIDEFLQILIKTSTAYDKSCPRFYLILPLLLSPCKRKSNIFHGTLSKVLNKGDVQLKIRVHTRFSNAFMFASLKPLPVTKNSVGLRTAAAVNVGAALLAHVTCSGRSQTDDVISN